MNTITFIAIIGLLLAVRELVIGTYVWYSRRKFKHIYQFEKTQQHFAVARNSLMCLAIENKVDVNSDSFKSFYFFNTALMRRSDQYPEFSLVATQVFLSSFDSEFDGKLNEESRNWSPEFKEVVKATARALDYIVLDYSAVVKVMFWLERRNRPDSTPIRMLRRLANRSEKKAVLAIRRTQRAMYKMAEAAP